MELVVKNPPASAGDVRDTGWIRGSGISSGEGNGNPPWYSCLGNPINERSWQAMVQEVARDGHDIVTKHQ